MAKDDVHVLMYRILAYLFVCMKEGETPTEKAISHEVLHITRCYWLRVMEMLHDKGYTAGGFQKICGVPYVWVDDMEITFEGIEFMQENSGMQKALAFLKTLKDIIPGI